MHRIPTEKERKIIKTAALHNLRRPVKKSGKESCAVEELCDPPDAKDQEEYGRT